MLTRWPLSFAGLPSSISTNCGGSSDSPNTIAGLFKTIAIRRGALLNNSKKIHSVGIRRQKVNLKEALTKAPVLAFPNFSVPFELEVDAFRKGIGAVLMQQQQSIAFFNKALSPQHQLRSVYECELIALVLIILKWKHYLLGHRLWSIQTNKG